MEGSDLTADNKMRPGDRAGAAQAGAQPSAAELRHAYYGKRVLLTGHTGFKGSWLAIWLAELGAEVTGFARAPDQRPALFVEAEVERLMSRSILADLRDLQDLRNAVADTKPDFVFHLAAQSLVGASYRDPIETLSTNVLGTGHVLEALRLAGHRCACIIVTSDKCYENREWLWGYREDDALGGFDPYSMSKGAAELVTSSFRRSFFHPGRLDEHGIALASARAGNVVGGGDWAVDRIVPDAMRALADERPIPVRNPHSVRPWQHVLEPLGGYLLLGARLAGAGQYRSAEYCEPWNFGPRTEDTRPVRDLVDEIIDVWGSGAWVNLNDKNAPHEAGLLTLSSEKALARLGWYPRWRFDETIRKTVTWYRTFYEGAHAETLATLCRQQIGEYMGE